MTDYQLAAIISTIFASQLFKNDRRFLGVLVAIYGTLALSYKFFP